MKPITKKLCPFCKKVMNRYEYYYDYEYTGGGNFSSEKTLQKCEVKNCGCLEKMKEFKKNLIYVFNKKLEAETYKILFGEILSKRRDPFYFKDNIKDEFKYISYFATRFGVKI